MELRHLRYYKAVAELLNFSRAAEQLRIAQPALSRQIQALEHEIGTQLLDRNRVRVQLTDAGRAFYAQTSRILAQVDIAITEARQVAGGAGGELVICNDWRLGNHLVPMAIAEFRGKFPRADVVLRDVPFREQISLVSKRRAHLGFIVNDLLDKRGEFASLPILTSPIYVVLPARHALARRRALRFADLAKETWVALDEKQAPGFRAFLTQQSRLSGFTPRLGRTAGSIEAVFGLVASGYGVTIALGHILPRTNKLLRSVLTDCAPFELSAAWLRRETSPLLRRFMEILRAHVADAPA